MSQSLTENHKQQKKCIVSDKERAFYKKNGYLIIRNVLSENECDEYISEAHRVRKVHSKSRIFIESQINF